MKPLEITLPERVEETVPEPIADPEPTEEQKDERWRYYLCSLSVPQRFETVPRRLDAKPEIQAWIDADKEPWCLALIGDVGTGKTYQGVYALGWIANAYRSEDRRRLKARFYDVADLLRETKENFGDDGDPHFLTNTKRRPALMLDDVGSQRATDFALETLAEILRYRYNAMLPTIVTANVSKLSELEGLGFDARLVSRIASGAVVKFTGKDRRLT